MLTNVKTTIVARQGIPKLNLVKLLHYKDLLYYITLRDIKVRYTQTLLGVTWIVIQPFIQMVIYTAIFGNIAKLDSEGIPYAIYTFTTLVPWTYFSNIVNRATLSVVSNSGMVKKIYFPRLLLPISAVLSSFVDFIVCFIILLLMMFWFNFTVTIKILLLPLLLIHVSALAVGVGFWLAALNVQFRDVKVATPYLIQLWFWISPVAYSSNVISDNWAIFYPFNPVVPILDGFRWVILGTAFPPLFSSGVSLVITLLILISGMYYFRHMERTFADIS